MVSLLDLPTIENISSASRALSDYCDTTIDYAKKLEGLTKEDIQVMNALYTTINEQIEFINRLKNKLHLTESITGEE